MDYASNVWTHAHRAREAAWLNKAQLVGAQAITGAFRTVATAVAEAEASIQTVEERHRQAATRLCINLRTLPKTHPLAALKNKASKRFISPMQKIVSAVGRVYTDRMESVADALLNIKDPKIVTSLRGRPRNDHISSGIDTPSSSAAPASSAGRQPRQARNPAPRPVRASIRRNRSAFEEDDREWPQEAEERVKRRQRKGGLALLNHVTLPS